MTWLIIIIGVPIAFAVRIGIQDFIRSLFEGDPSGTQRPLLQRKRRKQRP